MLYKVRAQYLPYRHQLKLETSSLKISNYRLLWMLSISPSLNYLLIIRLCQI
ncbi:hypothetical protein [Aeromonas phage Akh-2]|nr:hypothetical protein [Aeromonas phage Akh-2]